MSDRARSGASDIPRNPNASPALQGVRVVDFTHFIAGPMCTRFLGDMGADVIKIENAAAGDDLRRFEPSLGGESVPYLWANRNKRGVALDLSRDAAKQIVRDLILTADILVENFSTGVMERFGLGYEVVKELNPKLIYCSVSAYGRDGKLADRLGFDTVVQAETGFMSLNGFPDGPGMRTGPAIMDIATGLTATIGVLGALAARSRTGCGQRVETSLFDVGTLMLGFQALGHLATGKNPKRVGNDGTDSMPTGTFATADGTLYLICPNDRTFGRLVRDVLNRPDLVDDPRFLTNRDRMQNRAELRAVVESELARDGSEGWAARMREQKVPVGVIRTVEEAFQSPEMAERGVASTIVHPTAGAIPDIACPLRLAGTPVVDAVAAPTLGQHTAEVLHMLGYNLNQIAEWSAAGVFGKRAV
jgi:crotonobetainyl-CoA:carnitine CoA-transferase CaiB-like acyl-CoA transferase